jgi:hypothetical protein
LRTAGSLGHRAQPARNPPLPSRGQERRAAQSQEGSQALAEKSQQVVSPGWRRTAGDSAKPKLVLGTLYQKVPLPPAAAGCPPTRAVVAKTSRALATAMRRSSGSSALILAPTRTQVSGSWEQGAKSVVVVGWSYG